MNQLIVATLAQVMWNKVIMLKMHILKGYNKNIVYLPERDPPKEKLTPTQKKNEYVFNK